jgi:hypothetical protein
VEAESGLTKAATVPEAAVTVITQHEALKSHQ